MSDFNELLEEYAAVAAYIDDKESDIARLKKVRDNIKTALMACMNDIGLSTAKSQAGHRVDVVTNSGVRVVDAEAFFDFVFESGDADFLTKRADVESVKAYLAANNELPPGVEMTQAQTVRFTKAK